MRLKKGDLVLVIAGKDKNKTGKIERILPKINKVIVSGVNLLKKHTRPSKKNPHGGVILKETPISASNVMILCPNCQKPTRVKIKIGEKKIRICQKCGQSLEII